MKYHTGFLFKYPYGLNYRWSWEIAHQCVLDYIVLENSVTLDVWEKELPWAQIRVSHLIRECLFHALNYAYWNMHAGIIQVPFFKKWSILISWQMVHRNKIPVMQFDCKSEPLRWHRTAINALNDHPADWTKFYIFLRILTFILKLSKENDVRLPFICWSKRRPEIIFVYYSNVSRFSCLFFLFGPLRFFVTARAFGQSIWF